MLKSIFRNRRGNVAIITALTIVPVLAILGGGADVVRATTLNAKLRGAIDGASLAAANLESGTDVDTIVREYLAANLKSEPDFLAGLDIDVDPTVGLNYRRIEVTVKGSVDTMFLGLVGVKSLPVEARTIATESKTNVEIVLVLDVSSSMSGDRITNLKSAANSFIDTMLRESEQVDRTSISVVPFGGTVNIGALYDDIAVDAGVGVATDPTEYQYSLGSNVPFNDFLFTSGDECIEMQPADFSGALFPADSRSQVPHFWKWNNFNPWCPNDNSAVFLNSNQADLLKAHINGMTLSDGTGMDIGAAWGLKALDPRWQGMFGGDFDDRPAAYDGDTMKVLVVMTDGGITAQFRPENWTHLNTHDNRPTNNAPDGAGSGNSGDNNNQQTTVSQGNTSSLATDDNAVGFFKRVCDEAETQGAIVYTIGFQISPGSLPEDMLQYCASDINKYHLVDSLDIQSAFDTIAASVNALRITLDE